MYPLGDSIVSQTENLAIRTQKTLKCCHSSFFNYLLTVQLFQSLHHFCGFTSDHMRGCCQCKCMSRVELEWFNLKQTITAEPIEGETRNINANCITRKTQKARLSGKSKIRSYNFTFTSRDLQGESSTRTQSGNVSHACMQSGRWFSLTVHKRQVRFFGTVNIIQKKTSQEETESEWRPAMNVAWENRLWLI